MFTLDYEQRIKELEFTIQQKNEEISDLKTRLISTNAEKDHLATANKGMDIDIKKFKEYSTRLEGLNSSDYSQSQKFGTSQKY